MILNTIKQKNMLFFLLLIHSFTETSLALMGTNSSALLPSLSSSSSTLRNPFDYAPIAAKTVAATIAAGSLIYYMGFDQYSNKFSLRALQENTIPTTRVLGILGLGAAGLYYGCSGKLFNLIPDKKFIIGAMASGAFFYFSFKKKLDTATERVHQARAERDQLQRERYQANERELDARAALYRANVRELDARAALYRANERERQERAQHEYTLQRFSSIIREQDHEITRIRTTAHRTLAEPPATARPPVPARPPAGIGISNNTNTSR